MPVPSSVTVTRMPASPDSAARSVTTSIRRAPLRRAFWASSANTSESVALKKRVTRAMALSWTRARIGAGRSERCMAMLSRRMLKRKRPPVGAGGAHGAVAGAWRGRLRDAAQEGWYLQRLGVGVVAIAAVRRKDPLPDRGDIAAAIGDRDTRRVVIRRGRAGVGGG